MVRYKIVKFFRDGRKPSTRNLPKGLTLDEAQRYCSREDTYKVKKDGTVEWFCGFTVE